MRCHLRIEFSQKKKSSDQLKIIQMKKILLTSLIAFITMVHLLGQNDKMVIEGSISIGGSEEASPSPGTIRWTGIDFEAFNGLTWVTLTGGKNCTGNGCGWQCVSQHQNW